MSAAYPAGNAVQRAYLVLREEGLRSFWFKLASTLGYRRLLLLERSLQETVPQFEPKLPLELGVLEVSEVDDHLAFRPDIPRQEALHRLRSAQECFVARSAGRIVSACWATTRSRWNEFLSCELAVVPGEVHMFDAFTLPTFRGQGAAPAVCMHQLAHFRRQGLRRAIRATLPENTPALRAHAKSGFTPYALVRSIKIGPWQHTIESLWQ